MPKLVSVWLATIGRSFFKALLAPVDSEMARPSAQCTHAARKARRRSVNIVKDMRHGYPKLTLRNRLSTTTLSSTSLFVHWSVCLRSRSANRVQLSSRKTVDERGASSSNIYPSVYRSTPVVIAQNDSRSLARSLGRRLTIHFESSNEDSQKPLIFSVNGFYLREAPDYHRRKDSLVIK